MCKKSLKIQYKYIVGNYEIYLLGIRLVRVGLLFRVRVIVMG
jgi:hypothetical protein